MSESQVNQVVIVGGGITGGVLALGLRQRGVEVVLVDLRTELGGVGHGITLQGNALKAFDSVGLYERLKERGFAFSHLRMKTPDGHVIAEMPTPPMGGPDLPGTMGAVRGDIADLLEEMVAEAGVDVRLGTTLTAIDDHGDSVTVTLSDGSQETVDLLVGADGIRSKVREMIGIETKPEPVGMGIWRTVAKRPAGDGLLRALHGRPEVQGRLHADLRGPLLRVPARGEPRPVVHRRGPQRRAAQGARPGLRRDLGPGPRQPRRRRDRQLRLDRGDLRRLAVAPRPHDHHRRRRARLPAADRAGRRDVRRGRGGPRRDADVRRHRRGRASGVHGPPLPAREDGARQQPHPRRVGDRTRRPRARTPARSWARPSARWCAPA